MEVTGNGRVHRSESEWRELISRWEASGQSLREFCREQEIQISSFQRWRQKLAGSSTARDFVSVRRSTVPPAPSASWALELVLPNGCILRFQG